jgi:hypothetical protein
VQKNSEENLQGSCSGIPVPGSSKAFVCKFTNLFLLFYINYSVNFFDFSLLVSKSVFNFCNFK